MSIAQGFYKSIAFTPNAIATRCEQRIRTFSDQAYRVKRLASALQHFGVKRGEVVSILALNSDWYLEVILASVWRAAVFNPLNIRWSVTELAHGLNDSGSKILCVDTHFAPLVATLLPLCQGIEQVILMGDSSLHDFLLHDGMHAMETLIAEHKPVAATAVLGNSVAALFYTGGTTGLSKGVKLSHNNMMTAVLGALATGDIVTRGKMLHVAPLFHLAGIWPWLIQLTRGGCHVILGLFNPQVVCDLIESERIVSTLLVPTMIDRVAQQLEANEASLSGLKTLLYAGSPIPDVLTDKLPILLPNARLCQTYGMTELAPVATLLLPEDHKTDKKRSVGRAAAHALIKIVDAKGELVIRGDIGEIAVSGAHVMHGYLNRDDETAATVREGWMHTGDAGYLDADGYLFLVDRIKDMVVTGGENVFSVEVENVLSSQPAIASCAVIGLPDEKWGERVHAVVVLKAGKTVTIDDVKSHVSQHLAKYKVPQSLTVVDELPLSAAGKVLKRTLREGLASGV